MTGEQADAEARGSSPVGRGGAGTYIEGELGAFYLLAMLAGTEPRGMPGSRIERVRFQGVELGYALDDLIIEGVSSAGSTLLEIQSKRTISFSPKDTVFKEVCGQIAKTCVSADHERHLLAVATQRTSFRISGPYQDVLQWARAAGTSDEFFRRLTSKGVASPAMRDFVGAFRANLVAAGVEDDDAAIWQILRRFLILEFDFEANAPLARTHALSIARQILSDQDASRAEALWSNLIEIAIATAKAGGSLDRETLRKQLIERGFRLAGDRDFALARARLAEMARLALANIGTSVAGVNLPRVDAIAAVDKARDSHRLVEIRGGPGVGKSAVLRHVAERVARESHVIVLDPVGTPEGGWSVLAQTLGVPTTASEFLNDLAASGGGTLFIDSLEMFTSPGRQRTVNDLLREVSSVQGFTVVATARPEFGKDGESWLAEDAIAALGSAHQIAMAELSDAEVEVLSSQAPELCALLAPGHPAAPIARNLYRLSRLLKVPTSAIIRTEASLAEYWWRTADGAAETDVRAAQRIVADLANAALAGRDVIELTADSPARSHLLRSRTLRETKRDHISFAHDVLREWAVAARIHEDPDLLAALDMSNPVSPQLARGIELAGRLALEMHQDCRAWLGLLSRLPATETHSSWRRQVLMAIMRSELSPVLLERCSDGLLADGGALLSELCTTIGAVDTIAAADLIKQAAANGNEVQIEVPRSLRIASTGSAPSLLKWCVNHAGDIPLQAIDGVVKLVQIQHPMLVMARVLAEPTAKMLFGWLQQLDIRNQTVTIPSEGTGRIDRQGHGRFIEELRSMALLLASHAPAEVKAYLRAVTAEHDTYKVKAIRPLSQTLARVAPAELAAMIAGILIEPPDPDRPGRDPRDRALGFADTDYLPPSPAQPPFLDLLEASPEIGLGLVRQLTQEAVSFHSQGADPGDDGYTLVFDSGPRFFPWTRTYFWSRDQAREYSAASGLMALEAWGHDRIEAGEPIETVLADILGPEESCAAFLLVAVDLLISHWPASREALVPFVACPALLATERGRELHDQLGHVAFGLQEEPAGRVRLTDLRARPSRGVPLERVLIGYLQDDDIANKLRARLASAVQDLGAYGERADFGDPAFMGAYALNQLDRSNWVPVEGGFGYRSPPAEADHLARLQARHGEHVRSSEIEARIHLAAEDPARSSPAVAREAAEHAAGDLPDDTDTDVLKSRSTRLIVTAMLVARDGDEALLDEKEAWVRAVIERALAEESDRHRGSSDMLRFNRPALATCALIHLWHRRRQQADRNALIAIATRTDRCAPPAFAAALDALIAADPRVLKAAMRAAFGSCRWRWHPWDEDEAEQRAYEREKAADNARAVAAEIAWLDGGAEPEWPAFPDEVPSLRRGLRLPVPDAEAQVEIDRKAAAAAAVSNRATIHADHQAAAQWLRILTSDAGSAFDWRGEIVDAYATWSAKLNGYGFGREAELDRTPSDWNFQFYVLVAIAAMNAPDPQFDELVQPIVGLPDRSFGDVTETLIQAADASYFNNPQRPAARLVDLRTRLVQRAMTLRRWKDERRAGDLSIDHDTGGVVAKLLLNTHDPFTGTKTYLVQGVFDRIDPVLDTLRPMLAGGPTAFVALCTMNMLMVAPRARHLDFLLSALEAWLERLPSDRAMWIELGIGRKVGEWFDKATIEEPGLLGRDHPQRDRIDAMLGRLVAVGVPEAHELEVRIECERVEAGSLNSTVA